MQAEKKKPDCPNRKPVKVNVTAGQTIYWCTCGKSANQPFCDGSHSGTGFAPLPYTAKEGETDLNLCQCKRTTKAPFCDGTHKNDALDW